MKINKDLDEKILNLKRQGKKQKEIAELLNVSNATISKRLSQMRLNGIKAEDTKERVSDEDILAFRLKGYKIEKIAKILGVSSSTISRRMVNMRKNGVNIPRSVAYNNDINSKILELKKQGKTQKEIAEQLNISISSVSSRLQTIKRDGIVIEAPKSESDTLNEKIITLREKGMGNNEIAEKLGLCLSTISHRVGKIKNKGINVPKPKRKRKADNIDNKVEELKRQGLTQVEIAKELGVTISKVYATIKKLKQDGIEFPEDVVGLNSTDRKIIEMRKNNATIHEIAKTLGVTKMAIDKRIRKMKKCNVEVPESAYRARRSDLKEKIGEKKLAKAILKLQESKNASEQQLKIIADYYGVDLNIVAKLVDFVNEK